MSLKTYPAVFFRFFIEYRRFYNNLEISIISVLRIFIELRVSDVIQLRCFETSVLCNMSANAQIFHPLLREDIQLIISNLLYNISK